MVEMGAELYAENPEAENLGNLEQRYYESRAAGKARDHVLVYYCNRYGFVKEGKPVFPEYRDEVHAGAEPIAAVAAWPLYVGLDFGLTPAALFAQRSPAEQCGGGSMIW